MIHTEMKITIIVMEENPDKDSLAEFFTDLPFDPFVGAERIMHRDVLSTWVRVEGQEISKYYIVARKP
jgi:hypothetical protein